MIRILLSLFRGGFSNWFCIFNLKWKSVQKLESLLKDLKSKTNFSDDLSHNILKLCKVLRKTWFAASKAGLDTQYENLCVQATPRDAVKFRIVRNWKILEKSQIWLGTQLSTQPPFYKWIFGTSGQKFCRNRCQSSI